MPRLKLKKLTTSPPLAERRRPGGGTWQLVADGAISRHIAFGPLLGKGAIGHVFAAVERAGGRKNVAVKVVALAKLNKIQRDDLDSEVEILSHLQHSNVIHLKSVPRHVPRLPRDGPCERCRAI